MVKVNRLKKIFYFAGNNALFNVSEKMEHENGRAKKAQWRLKKYWGEKLERLGALKLELKQIASSS